MPDIRVIVGELYGFFFYRFVFPNGDVAILAVAPLTPDVAGSVLGGVTEEYSLVVPLEPRGRAWSFLRGFTFPVEYVRAQTDLVPWAASFLARLLPSLTRVEPVDNLVELAAAWYARPTGGAS